MAVKVIGEPVVRVPPVAEVAQGFRRGRTVGCGNSWAHPFAGTVVPSTVIGDAVVL